ncbi:unnamed protein product [Malus baccata var. baccata]
MEQLAQLGDVQFVSACSDNPGKHDFELLRMLVLPDGITLRAKLQGRPTRECLFSDPESSKFPRWFLSNSVKFAFIGLIKMFNPWGAITVDSEDICQTILHFNTFIKVHIHLLQINLPRFLMDNH